MSERFILIGHPVGHSLSPAIHGAAYRLLERDAHYEALDAPDEEAVARHVAALRDGALRGANVTVPWKRLALSLADRVDESAALVGAANVLARAEDGAVVAHNTDARGLADELSELIGESGGWRAQSSACVIGNGGAALGAVAACRLAGASRIRVVARGFAAQVARAEWPRREELVRLGAELCPWPVGADPEVRAAWAQATRGTQLFVQATSAGMQGADSGEVVAGLIEWQELANVVAYDLVYNPAETPFLARARASGHLARGGLGMLVRQAALALEIWWGALPPLDPLLAAAERALHRGARAPGAGP